MNVPVFPGSSFKKKKNPQKLAIRCISFPATLVLPTSAAVPRFNLFLYDNYYLNSSGPIDIRICQFGLVEFLINVLVES